MANYYFLILKNPFVGFTSLFFFGHQVVKICPKKKPWKLEHFNKFLNPMR